jgi:hypothetical protein
MVQETEHLQFARNPERVEYSYLYFTEFSDGSIAEFALVTKAEPLKQENT